MKTIFKIFCCLFLFAINRAGGWGLCTFYRTSYMPKPRPTITEQMKSIQIQVGCKLIDGEIGPETKPLVNAAVAREKAEAEKAAKSAKRQKFNKYANKYMTNTGSPKSE